MNYEDARKYIDSIAKFGSKLGLDNIRNLMRRLGDPQKKLRFIHIAGTNGKGSTVAFINSILIKAGYWTGMYTSPFVERFSERIRVDDTEISEEDFAALATCVREEAEKMKEDGEGAPTEFELICAIAFLYFCEKKCDICILEVGLGGRLDATNVIDDPLLCIITSISYDHMDILGDTLEKIAYEKAGIIKEGSRVLIYPQTDGVKKVISDVCEKRGAVLNMAEMPSKLIRAGLDGVEFVLGGDSYRIKLLGDYQINNAALAISAIRLLENRGIDISEDDIREGLKNTRWPARFEVLRQDPCVIIDGSHNVQGMEKLSSSLKLYFGDRKIVLIVGILRDKEYGRMLDVILPHAKKVYTVTVPSPRTLTAAELLCEVRRRTNIDACSVEDPVRACKMALKEAGDTDVICACGSLYYVGLIRKTLLSDDYKFSSTAAYVDGQMEDR